MQKAISIVLAIVGLLVGALLSYFIFNEWIHWTGKGVMKLSAGIAILGAVGGFKLGDIIGAKMSAGSGTPPTP